MRILRKLIFSPAKVAPAGMIDMMIAAMFSATASTLSSALRVAGVLTDDICRRLKPNATDAQILHAGRFFTLLIGLYMLAGALILPRLGSHRDVIILIGSLINPAILLLIIWGSFRRIGAGCLVNPRGRRGGRPAAQIRFLGDRLVQRLGCFCRDR